MNRYILQAPNSWHQWQQVETRPAQRQAKDERREERAGVGGE